MPGGGDGRTTCGDGPGDGGVRLAVAGDPGGSGWPCCMPGNGLPSGWVAGRCWVPGAAPGGDFAGWMLAAFCATDGGRAGPIEASGAVPPGAVAVRALKACCFGLVAAEIVAGVNVLVWPVRLVICTVLVV